ncbi:hypothetical protein [Dactylosporangium sp. NPDC051484]|uniref:hypothetical protein n=1 Tax=Dactylosporangium sp. NPDC051484 TaxID=3154942 RepID=UPI00344B9570
MQDESARGPVAYLVRPHRAALVARTLDELRGPVRGVVELPQRLMWNPQRRFDLGNHDLLLWMYENVLREAIRHDELRRFLNKRLLVQVWPELNLPHGVRRAWEARHAALRSR